VRRDGAAGAVSWGQVAGGADKENPAGCAGGV